MKIDLSPDVPELSPEEERHIAQTAAACGADGARVSLGADGDLEVEYRRHTSARPFERIRRITGYLSPLPKWNNAKQAELKDRVLHDAR